MASFKKTKNKLTSQKKVLYKGKYKTPSQIAKSAVSSSKRKASKSGLLGLGTGIL